MTDPPPRHAPRTSALALFEAAAKRQPAAPAIHYFDATLSYGELDRMAATLAASLTELGLAPGDRVALYLQNVPQFVIAQCAVWKAGGVVVPLNPMLKEAELSYHLNDAGARVLICLESLYERTARRVVPQTPVERVVTTSELDCLPPGAPVPPLLAHSTKLRVVETHDLAELCRSRRARAAQRQPRGEDLAFLTYTSGTTGTAKGAMNSHANVVHNARVYQSWLQLGPDDVILGVAPLFHITGMIGHLAAAAQAEIPVILFYRFDVAEALRLVERWRATFTVGAIPVLIAMDNHPDVARSNLTALRKVGSGGAPVAPAVVGRFRAVTEAHVHNIYGMTETTSPSHAVAPGGDAADDAATGAHGIGV